jgi:hypothetical protein
MKLQKRNFELKKRNLTDKISTYTSERFTGIMHHSLKVLKFGKFCPFKVSTHITLVGGDISYGG